MHAGKDESASGIATPSAFEKTQPRIPNAPTENAMIPTIFSSGSIIIDAPNKMDAISNNVKNATEKYKCRTPKASEKTPIPMSAIIAEHRITEPILISHFFLSVLIKKPIEKTVQKIPHMISPALNRFATGDTPKSLRALSHQLNHGERAIEMSIDESAIIGPIIPNRATNFETKNRFNSVDKIVSSSLFI